MKYLIYANCFNNNIDGMSFQMVINSSLILENEFTNLNTDKKIHDFCQIFYKNHKKEIEKSFPLSVDYQYLRILSFTRLN